MVSPSAMPSFALPLRRIALAAALGLVAQTVAACSYDWDVGPSPGTTGDGGTGTGDGAIPGAGVTHTCRVTMSTCDFTCSSSVPAPCTTVCEGGSRCSSTCSRRGCTMRCEGGASCEFTCSGGGCIFECPTGSSCTSTCSGGGCVLRCGFGGCGETSCSGGGCTTTSL